LCYVPIGSIKKGEGGDRLSIRLKGATHAALRAMSWRGHAGYADRPAHRGAYAGYLARQLFDFKTGARAGQLAATMRPTVDSLSEDDIFALAAYVSSLPS
jgi:hypothetical protein